MIGKLNAVGAKSDVASGIIRGVPLDVDKLENTSSQTELERESVFMNNSTEELINVIQILKNRLGYVLHQDNLEEGEGIEDYEPGTEIGKFLHTETLQVQSATHILRNLIERLGI